MRSDRDLWSSRNSKFYFGCSNASKKFESAYYFALTISFVFPNSLIAFANFFVHYHYFDLKEAEAIVRPNRYLAIATSGGLNQQRTGVFFWNWWLKYCTSTQQSWIIKVFNTAMLFFYTWGTHNYETEYCCSVVKVHIMFAFSWYIFRLQQSNQCFVAMLILAY